MAGGQTASARGLSTARRPQPGDGDHRDRVAPRRNWL